MQSFSSGVHVHSVTEGYYTKLIVVNQRLWIQICIALIKNLFCFYDINE